MVNQDYKFFTKIIDKEKLYKYLYLEWQSQHINIINLQRKFNITSTTAIKLWDLIIDNKVLTIWEEVLENFENDPYDPENELWCLKKTLIKEEIYREASIIINKDLKNKGLNFSKSI